MFPPRRHCHLSRSDIPTAASLSLVAFCFQWQKLEMSMMERRKIMCSVSFHVVAITCVIWSLYVLIDRTTKEIRSGVLEWPFWTKLIVVAIGFTGGLVFMYVQCKTYALLCRRWRAYNRIIFIQNLPSRREKNTSFPVVMVAGDVGTSQPTKPDTHIVQETELL